MGLVAETRDGRIRELEESDRVISMSYHRHRVFVTSSSNLIPIAIMRNPLSIESSTHCIDLVLDIVSSSHRYRIIIVRASHRHRIVTSKLPSNWHRIVVALSLLYHIVIAVIVLASYRHRIAIVLSSSYGFEPAFVP